jgi:hypothetical protein
MICRSQMLLVLASAALATAAASPAVALSTKECSVKYKAAKKDGSLGAKNWAEFRKESCGADAKGTPEKSTSKSGDKAKPAEPKVASGPAVYPSSLSAKFASQTPAKQRFHTCLDQYNANKATGSNGGLKWIQKAGGGYYSECNKRLKG